MYQVSFDDIERINSLAKQPGRTAFVDECGNFGFDFDKEGTSLHYIVCAVIVKNQQIHTLENETDRIRNIYFGKGEMKSSSIGGDNRRRSRVCAELLMLDFSLILLIANKQEFRQGSPLVEYKNAFLKYLHQKLYDTMYTAYPKLKIIEDEYGTSEFQSGYREYIRTHRPEPNLLDEYDFDYVDSKHSPLVQIADIIAGSIAHHQLDESAPDILKIFQSKIRGVVDFPSKFPVYYADPVADSKFNTDIYALADRCATNYIDAHSDTHEFDERLRVLFLRHLLFFVRNVSSSSYMFSGEIMNILSDLSDSKVSRDHVYRKIIAPLRDEGVIIASCSHGYKIPTCTKDIIAYINQTNGVVGPMLSRVGKCRSLILGQTDGALDILSDPAFTKYKRYFGDFS